MCLAVPALVHEVRGLRATVKALGCQEDVDVRLVPGVAVGDYVLVHAGFAIQRLAASAGDTTLAWW